tara:strand:- start:1723 stop:1899 length:177 start_codon:yes stop_codon:yes gene_type:complete
MVYNPQYTLQKIKMEIYDEINRYQAILARPNDGALSNFEQGKLQTLKDIFGKIEKGDW